MKIFLSWSGHPSKRVAEALRDWLPKVLHTTDPWMSEVDIPMGSRWASTLSSELEETAACIVCLAPDNLHSTWLHFEAGEVGKFVERSLVCPYLMGIKKNELDGPLSMFQAAPADRDGTKRLVETLNNSPHGPGIKSDVLSHSFDKSWPELESKLEEIELYPYSLSNILMRGVEAIIDSSNLPMYFVDTDFNIKHCNDHLVALIDSSASNLVGQSVQKLVEGFSRRVPQTRRQEFLNRQDDVSRRILSDYGSHTEDIEYVDNRDLHGNLYKGIYRIWIHADKVCSRKRGQFIGVFVVYQVEELDSISEIPGPGDG